MGAHYEEFFEIKEVECKLSIETLKTSKKRVLNIQIGCKNEVRFILNTLMLSHKKECLEPKNFKYM